MTRREFLSLGWLRGIRSRDGASTTADKVIEYGGEGIAALTILALAVTGSQDRKIWYSASSAHLLNNSEEFGATQDSISRLEGIMQDMGPQLEELEMKWRQAYMRIEEETYITTEEQCDDKDRCETVTVTKKRKVEKWYEPSQLIRMGINRHTIEEWRLTTAGFQAKVASLAGSAPQAFDLKKGVGGVNYERHEQDKDIQLTIATVLYSLVGLGFISYEEVDELVSRVLKSEPIFNGNIYIKRRTFLKLATAFGLNLVVRGWQVGASDKNRNLRSDIDENAGRVARELDVSDEENFKRMLGLNPREVIGHIDMVGNLAEKAGVQEVPFDFSWPQIRESFQKLRGLCNRAHGNFSEFFMWGGNVVIPPELTRAIKDVWGSAEIRGFVDGRKLDLDLNHFFNAGALTLLLGLFSVLGEKLAYPAADRVLDNAS